MATRRPRRRSTTASGPSLSVDVETSVPNDFFTQMRTVFSLQKNEVWARRLAGDKNPPKFLTTREVLEFATIEGARANGLERKVGTLTPGKEADIILLRTDLLNVMPMNNAVGAVVTSMGPQNVDTVLIGGKVMKRNGQLVGVDLATAHASRHRGAGAQLQERRMFRTSASDTRGSTQPCPCPGCGAAQLSPLSCAGLTRASIVLRR